MAWKKPIFALVTVLLFFGIVEGLLWAAGVETLLSRRDPFRGFSGRLDVFELDSGNGLYRTPPRAVAHSFNYQQFLAQKPDNGFRVFVLGGSSAQGFPWGEQAAFTRLLGDALQAVWPDRIVEAVNAAAMSYGSHRLRILAQELVRYEPDVLVVYGGHNEFVERRFYSDILNRPRPLNAVRGLLYRSRLYSIMATLGEEALEDGPIDTDAQTAGQLLGVDVRREYSVDVVDAERAEVIRHFDENLRAIITVARDRDVRVVLCTVPSNLAGWPPNQSRFDDELEFEQRQAVLGRLTQARASLERGQFRDAAETLEPATRIAPHHAESQFLYGKALAALGRADEARAAFTLARDNDAGPSRASTALNRVIRRVADEEGTFLVDIERVFEEASPQGLVGFDLLEDYVHPNPAGHRLIARELWAAFQTNGLVGPNGVVQPEEFERVMSRTGGVSTDGSNQQNPSWLFNVGVVLEKQGLFEQAIQKYQACLTLDPGYYVAYFNLGRLLFQQGRFLEAARMHSMALDVEPDYVRGMIGLGEALRRLDRGAEAEGILRRAVELDPSSADAWGSLGGVLSQLGRQEEAEAAFSRATRLDPEDAGALADLGYTLLFQAKIDAAEAAFRASLRLRAEDLRTRNGLAAVLTELGKLDEAERMFLENLEIDPGNSFARGGLAEIRERRAELD